MEVTCKGGFCLDILMIFFYTVCNDFEIEDRELSLSLSPVIDFLLVLFVPLYPLYTFLHPDCTKELSYSLPSS